MKDKSIFGYLRLLALIVVMAGAVGSLLFMFHAGRNQKSILLVAVFTIWVLSPFIALLYANMNSNLWLVSIRVPLFFLTIFIALGSLFSYSGALGPAGTKPAFKFLIVPLVSWLLIVIIIRVLASRSRKLPHKSKDAN